MAIAGIVAENVAVAEDAGAGKIAEAEQEAGPHIRTSNSKRRVGHDLTGLARLPATWLQRHGS